MQKDVTMNTVDNTASSSKWLNRTILFVLLMPPSWYVILSEMNVQTMVHFILHERVKRYTVDKVISWTNDTKGTPFDFALKRRGYPWYHLSSLLLYPL